MSDPNEPLKGLLVPSHASDVGSWDTPVNGNSTAIGGMLGGLTTIALSAATTIALTGPSGSITPGAGPTQQQNAMIRFTGSQSGTATIQFSLPGFYLIDHQASTSFPIVLAPATGTGTQIGAPWWRKCHIFFDGTNVDYANPPEPGSAIDLHGVTSIPNWMQVCTRPYALVKDGTSYSTANFSGLFNVIGTTFGGSGGSFNVPDEGQRMRMAWSGSATRVTSGGSGIAGNTMGASGGNELMPSHQHANTATVNDPGHSHTEVGQTANGSAQQGPLFGQGASLVTGNFPTATATTNISITMNNATTGSGNSQNMPPTIVSFLALIKT